MALAKRHSTLSGVETIWDAKPRVVVAFATRPGANFADPSGIRKPADKVESSKALAQSLISPCPTVRRANRIAPSRITVTIIQFSSLFPASIAARLQVNHVASILAILGKGVTSTMFCKKMPDDVLTVGVVRYVKIMQWLIPLSMVVPFLAFIVGGESSYSVFRPIEKPLTWFYALLFGGFLISIPFVFLECKNSGFRCLVTVVASWLILVIINQYPTQKNFDGCSCGLRRSWYPWHGQKLKFTIEEEGNPNHQHRIWDAQFNIEPYTPW
jgi:hypothetical protein